jgi:pSer/pThr/pTyr-binding forkhead associated (FHA) protein
VPETADDDEGKTRYMPGADLGKLKFPSTVFTLQLLDNTGQWRSWAPISPNGLNLGRSANSAHFPFLGSMAVRHVRFSFDSGQLMAQDLGSLNGTFLKLAPEQPRELTDGARFRVGSQVIEFHPAEPLETVPALTSDDGEGFLSFDLQPLAFLDLIRPDGKPGLRFPITKREPTKIGTDGKHVDIALPGAEWVSRQHAMIRHDGDRFLLEDLNSRNGTFLQIREPTPLSPGDVLLVGRAFLRVVDQP